MIVNANSFKMRENIFMETTVTKSNNEKCSIAEKIVISSEDSQKKKNETTTHKLLYRYVCHLFQPYYQ